MRNTSRRKRRGLSLVETIVTIAVFAMLALLATQLLIGGVQAWRKGQVTSELRSVGRKAMEEFATDFRQADSGTIVPQPPTTSPTPFYVLEFKRYRSNPTLSKDITYTLSGNKLTRDEDGKTVTLAENVLLAYPTDTPRSYFKWNWDASSGQARTLELSLYMIDDAATMDEEPNKVRQSFILTTTVFPMNKEISSVAPITTNSYPLPNTLKSPAAIENAVSLPTSLEDPRGPRFRLGPASAGEARR